VKYEYHYYQLVKHAYIKLKSVAIISSKYS